MCKTLIHFFTIADFEEEEIWLREQHKKGLKLVKMIIPCFYIFEECEPEDIIYRLDYQNIKPGDDYWKMLEDFGWEYIAHCLNWNYFRKKAEDIQAEEEGELFSDNASKVEMIRSVLSTRLIPLVVIFFCCIIPNISRILAGEMVGPWARAFTIIYSFLFVLYIYLITYCGNKLRKLKDKYSN